MEHGGSGLCRASVYWGKLFPRNPEVRRAGTGNGDMSSGSRVVQGCHEKLQCCLSGITFTCHQAVAGMHEQQVPAL